MRRSKRIEQRLHDLELDIGGPSNADRSARVYFHDHSYGLKGSIGQLWAAVRALQAWRDTLPEPKMRYQVTFTGVDHPQIHRRIMLWLTDKSIGTEMVVSAAHYSITFTDESPAALRQQVLTYAQRHQL